MAQSFAAETSESTIFKLMDHTKDEYWQRFTPEPPFYNQQTKSFNIDEVNGVDKNKIKEIVDDVLKNDPITIDLLHIDAINFVLIGSRKFSGNQEKQFARSINKKFSPDLVNKIIDINENVNPKFSILTSTMHSIISEFQYNFLPHNPVIKNSVKDNFCPRMFFCMGLFNQLLEWTATYQKPTTIFNNKQKIFEEFSRDFLEDVDQKKLNNAPKNVEFCKQYFIDHITYGVNYFDEYLNEKSHLITDKDLFKTRIDDLRRIFTMDMDNNFPNLNIEQNIIIESSNPPEQSKKETIQKEFRNIEVLEPSKDTFKVSIPTNQFTTTTIHCSMTGIPDVSSYTLTEKPYLNDMDTTEIQRFGIQFDEDANKIIINYADFANKFMLVNKYFTNPLSSPQVTVFKEIVKSYLFTQKNELPNITIEINIKDETDKLFLEAITYIARFDVAMHNSSKFETVNFKDNIQLIVMMFKKLLIKENIKYLRDYLLLFVEKCETDNALKNNEILKKKIVYIKKNISIGWKKTSKDSSDEQSQEEKIEKTNPSLSYPYQWIIGGSLSALIIGAIIAYKKGIFTGLSFNSLLERLKRNSHGTK